MTAHAAPRAGARPGATARTARALALAALLAYVATGGGRVVGSDEVAMLDLARAMLRGHIEVTTGSTQQGREGHTFTKNAAGQAIAALPLVALSEAGAARMPEPKKTLAVRFGASFFNAIVTAGVLAAFFAAARALGAGPVAAFDAALLLGFTTPLWVYAKSFMAEPMQALGLLLALAGAARASTGSTRAALISGLGAFIAVSVKLSMLPIAVACLTPLLASPRRAVWPVAGLVMALLGHGIYDFARFGTPFETGYGAQATTAAYTTPFLVGLYGLLISSGKGVLWFAPVLWIAPAGWRWMVRGRAAKDTDAGTAARRAAWGALLAWGMAFLLYARFQHWAGDGSFGPRYLVPLLPLAFLAVAFALDGASRARGRFVWALGALGLIVQLGGVGIYFGAQMREAGDYPYTLPLDHPRFMSDSHFNPRYSPIAGHWRMMLRNLGEHVRGQWPRIGAGGTPDARLGVSAEDQESLLHALDLWWLYLAYAGVASRALLLTLALLLIAAAGWALARARLRADLEAAGCG